MFDCGSDEALQASADDVNLSKKTEPKATKVDYAPFSRESPV
jgi:hypothetical protein